MEAGKDTDHLMIALFLAEGFEEIEALATADVLRRSQLDVQTVGVGGRRIRGAHGIEVTADILDQEWTADELEAVVLPGGMPGTLHLEQSPVVQRAIDIAVERGLLLAPSAPLLPFWGTGSCWREGGLPAIPALKRSWEASAL